GRARHSPPASEGPARSARGAPAGPAPREWPEESARCSAPVPLPGASRRPVSADRSATRSPGPAPPPPRCPRMLPGPAPRAPSPRYCFASRARRPSRHPRPGRREAPPSAEVYPSLGPRDPLGQAELGHGLGALTPAREPVILLPENTLGQEHLRHDGPARALDSHGLEHVGNHGAAHAQIQNRLGNSRGLRGAISEHEGVDAGAEIAEIEDLGSPGSWRYASASKRQRLRGEVQP